MALGARSGENTKKRIVNVLSRIGSSTASEILAQLHEDGHQIERGSLYPCLAPLETSGRIHKDGGARASMGHSRQVTWSPGPKRGGAEG